jgi:hypothetical protein
MSAATACCASSAQASLVARGVTFIEGTDFVIRQAFLNPLGVHALVWVGDTSPASVDYAVTKTKQTGYDLLELSLHDMANLDIADDIGEDNVFLHLDTYHMNIEEDDLVRPVRAVGDRLGYVHIGENHRGYLGSGHLDFTAFFHALADINYTGPITFESFSSAVIATELSNNLAIWRNLWNDGEHLAHHARSFMANHLTAANTS